VLIVQYVTARTLETLVSAATPPQGAAPPLSYELAAGTGVIALVTILIVWPVVAPSVIAAHEGGHALSASLFGGTITAVRLRHDQTGVTEFQGTGWFGNVFTALAGYLGPSGFGLLGAVLLARGRTQPVLWLTLVLLALLLFHIRNLFGVLVVLVTGGLVYAVTVEASPTLQTWFAYTWIWLLLLGGVRGVMDLHRGRMTLRQSGSRDTWSDSYRLRTLTYIPAMLWTGVFGLATGAALIIGAGILLGLIRPGG
jgi:hypothetical protein